MTRSQDGHEFGALCGREFILLGSGRIERLPQRLPPDVRHRQEDRQGSVLRSVSRSLKRHWRCCRPQEDQGTRHISSNIIEVNSNPPPSSPNFNNSSTRFSAHPYNFMIELAVILLVNSFILVNFCFSNTFNSNC